MELCVPISVHAAFSSGLAAMNAVRCAASWLLFTQSTVLRVGPFRLLNVGRTSRNRFFLLVIGALANVKTSYECRC